MARAVLVRCCALALTGALTSEACGLRADANAPIEISARSAELDHQQGLATYRGDVQVRQGSLQVQAAELIVTYAARAVVRIQATGQPARYRQSLDAEAGQVVAAADTIIYHVADGRVDLRGDARLTQAGNRLASEEIRYDIQNETAGAQSSSEEPIRMTLHPPRKPATQVEPE